MQNLKLKIKEYFELIKFEHTIFALPFALSGMLLANPDGWFEPETLVWVLLAMVGGRTAAMSLNRVIDADIDKKNPRTSNRAIPAGKIKKASALILALLSFIVMILSVWKLPLICKQLLPVAIIILVVYSFTKRFTSLSHLVLGSALGAAASGGWLAVSGEINFYVVIWGLAIVFWVSGFDVIYAIQDIDFDRKNKLFSIPAKLGVKNSLLLSKIFHLITAFLIIIIALTYQVGVFFHISTLFLTGMLIYEHSLLNSNDLTKINTAFFDINGYISIGIFLLVLLDKLFLTGVIKL